MKKKLFVAIAIALFLQAIYFDAYAQAYRFKIVNMVPANQSNEINNDTEPNIAVNPANPNIIAASAFTFSANRIRPDGTRICDTFPCPRIIQTSQCKAPIYFSTDGGETWILKDVLPSNNGFTHDISLAFSEEGYLYAAILKGCQFGQLNVNPHNNLRGFMVLRSASTLNTNHSIEILSSLQPIKNWFSDKYDMPWIIAKTVSSSSGGAVIEPPGNLDHIFVGINHFGNARSQNSAEQNSILQGKTATVMVANNGTSSSPVDFIPNTIETQPQHDKNPAGVRLAVHESGKVYAIFYRVIERTNLSNGLSVEQCNVVLVRDDNFGRTQFRNLTTGNMIEPPIVGAVIENDATLPLHYLSGTQLGYLEGNRLTGSDLAVAVDPNNPDHVFAAWCSLDRDASWNQEAYTLHFRHNTNGGNGGWLLINETLNKIKNAFNPAIAITNDGKVGFLYQQLNDEGLWETHFVVGSIRVNDTDKNSRERSVDAIHDRVLSRFHKNELNTIQNDGRKQLSDYLDMQAVDNTFYGVFAAINTPDPLMRPVTPNSRFPIVRPIYQRNEMQLLGSNTPPMIGTNPPAVRPSIDPFFFKIDPFRPERVCERCIQESSIIRLRPDASLTDEISLSMKMIYEKTFARDKIEAKTAEPFFHLLLEGNNLNEFDLKVIDADGNTPEQEVNKTKNGYAVSFKTSGKYFSSKDGLHDLYLILTVKNAKSIKGEKIINYKLEVNDMPFKEFIKLNK